MVGEGGTPLSDLEKAIRELQSCNSDIDPKRLRAAIDALEGVFRGGSQRRAGAWRSPHGRQHHGRVVDQPHLRHVGNLSRRSAVCRRARDRGCRFNGCDRPASWSTPHHIQYWAKGGPNSIANEVLLCHYHHRLVHEGGGQVVRVGREFRFIPPERVVMRRARGPGVRWAA